MAITLDTNRKRSILERMLVMRRFEELVADVAKDHFFGHYHLYIGEEGTGAAVLEALEPSDRILTTHRNHGHIVGRGADPGRALAEIMGHADGLNGGRGGTLHLTDGERGFLSTSAVVGGCIGLSTGAAYGLKDDPDGAIAVGFFGDGALEEGIAFESMNIAALWSLPILYVCENNSVGALGSAAGEFSTSVIAARNLTDIPKSLGIASMSVDGADAVAVYEAMGDALSIVRKRRGPVFLECITARWPGSRPVWPELLTGVTDLRMAWEPERIAGEHADWIRGHDPVLRFARDLVANGEVMQNDIMTLDEAVRARMAAARKFAVASPLPDAESALSGTFA